MHRDTRWRALATIGAVLAILATGILPPARVVAQDAEIEQDVYEPDDGSGQAHPLLLVGIPQIHTFHTAGDRDWVYIDIEVGDRVEILTTGDCDTYMTLYGPDGQTVVGTDDDSGGNGNAAFRFTSPLEATLFIEVRQFGRADTACGPYGLVGRLLPPPDPDAFEPDDTPQQAKILPMDGSVQQHSIHVPGDHDWVTLSVQTNTAFRLATTGECDTYLALYSADGQTVLAEDDDSGSLGNALINYTFTQAGTYYLLARLYDETVDVCDTYGLSAVSIQPSLPDAFEPDDIPEQAKPLPLDGSPQERSLHTPNDVDWVAFPLTAGDRVFFFTTGPCDTYVFLVGPDQRAILAEDDDSGEGSNGAILKQVAETGTYYAVVRLYGRSSPPCPSYQLQGIAVHGVLPTPTPPGGGTPGVAPSAPTPTPTAGLPFLVPPTAPTGSPTTRAPGASPTPRPAGQPPATPILPSPTRVFR